MPGSYDAGKLGSCYPLLAVSDPCITLEPYYASMLSCPEAGMLLPAISRQRPSDPRTLEPSNPFFYYAPIPLYSACLFPVPGTDTDSPIFCY